MCESLTCSSQSFICPFSSTQVGFMFLLNITAVLSNQCLNARVSSRDRVFRPGAAVTLECGLGAGFSMGSQTMFWYRQQRSGAPVEFLTREYDESAGHFQSSIDTSKNSFPLQIAELLLNDSGVYYCVASHSDAHRSERQTNTKSAVQKPRPIETPCADDCTKTLLCVASDFYPDHVSVSWRVGGQEVSRGVATDNAALRQGENYKITSRLRVSAEDWFKPETEFECIVSFFDGTGNTNHSASIFGGKGLFTWNLRNKQNLFM
uniref:Ig-like domain-containing protein n=1 Tax=Scophthalmus maximus TaxID=52904 RepID=A0A8D3ABA9_SCOMX